MVSASVVWRGVRGEDLAMTAVCGVGVVSLALTFARSGANEVGLDKAWRIDIRGAGLCACWS